MGTDGNWFDKFATLMDQNIRGVQYGVYAVAGIGFCVAMRSVRPLKKFQLPSDIPKHFIEKRMKFRGKITKIQGGKNPVLFIDHYPVIALPFRRESTGLPVKVSSVEVIPNGGIVLDSLLQGNVVSFIPLRADEEAVQSIVYKGKQDIGQHLVSIGFATVSGLDFSLDKDLVYSKYYKDLISTERKAERNGAGIWQDQQVGLFKKVVKSFSNLRYTVA